MKKNVKNYLIAIAALVILVGGYFAYAFYPKRANDNFSYYDVSYNDIKETVKVNGAVKPAQDVKLAFEKSAKIANVNVKVGDKVKAGQVLASLVNSDVSAQLYQAGASVKAAQALLSNYQAAYQSQLAKLNDLKNGPRPEDLEVSQTQVDNAVKSQTDANTNLANVKAKAQNDINNTYNKTQDVLNDSYAKAFDSVNIKISDLFLDANTDPKLTFTINNSTLIYSVESGRNNVNNDLTAIKNEIDGMDGDQTRIDAAINDSQLHLENIRNFLKDLNQAMNFALTSTSFTQATLDSYKNNISSALANINTAIASLQTQEQTIATQKSVNKNSITAAETMVTQADNALAAAQKAMTLKKAGTSQDQILAQSEVVSQAAASVTAQEAAISQAQANVMNNQAQVSKTVITAPLDGSVTQVDAKAGEISTQGVPVIAVMSNAKFQIDVMVPENKIGQIKIGQTADITLDVVGSETIFPAKVITINPGDILKNGSPSYKVTLEFTKDDEKIKDGLTASAGIIIAEKKNVLVIPALSVFQKGYDSYVLKNVNNKTEEAKIITGISQTDRIEVVSGLSQGDKVVDFMNYKQ